MRSRKDSRAIPTPTPPFPTAELERSRSGSPGRWRSRRRETGRWHPNLGVAKAIQTSRVLFQAAIVVCAQLSGQLQAKLQSVLSTEKEEI